MAFGRLLELARGLALPADEVATQVTAAIGMRGSGKSNVMAVIAEGLLDAGIQVVILDYVGIWPSLRLQPDGKTPSRHDIKVLGGRNGDLPLVPGAGAVVARALAAHRASAVLDVSQFTKGERMRFATDLGEALFQAKKEHVGPTWLLLEEAQRFIPQVVGPDQRRMLGAYEEIAEVGRNYGLGLGLITQRPQNVNKSVLFLADNVFAHRTNGTHERKSIRDWVQEKGAHGRDEVDGELPTLKLGQALVWSPMRDLYGRYQLFKKSTYDAGATPTSARAEVRIKPLDLGALSQAMTEVTEEAKASDPSALRGEVRRLNEQVKRLTGELERAGAKSAPVKPGKTITRVVAPKGMLRAMERAAAAILDAAEELDSVALGLRSKVTGIAEAAAALKADEGVREESPVPRAVERRQPAVIAAKVAKGNSVGEPLSKCARTILMRLAQLGAASDETIGAYSGYRPTSSTFGNAMSELRTRRYIDDGPPSRRQITIDGVAEAGDVEALPTGKELLAFWVNRRGQGALSRAARTMLEVVFSDRCVTREHLSEASGYRQTSSTFGNALSELRAPGLIYGPDGGDLTIGEAFQ